MFRCSEGYPCRSLKKTNSARQTLSSFVSNRFRSIARCTCFQQFGLVKMTSKAMLSVLPGTLAALCMIWAAISHCSGSTQETVLPGKDYLPLRTEGQCSRYEPGCSATSADHDRRYEHWTDIPKEMFDRAHLKPFGSHRPPDEPVDVLEYMIAPEDFYQHYVAKQKPVVIKRAASSWSASKLWTDEWLSKNMGHIELNMETKDDDKFNLPPRRTLGDFVRDYKSSNLYLVSELPPPMHKYIDMPLCLRCDEISQR